LPTIIVKDARLPTSKSNQRCIWTRWNYDIQQYTYENIVATFGQRELIRKLMMALVQLDMRQVARSEGNYCGFNCISASDENESYNKQVLSVTLLSLGISNGDVVLGCLFFYAVNY